MGFWEATKNDRQPVMSDEAIDVLHDAFEQIAEHYLEDLERKPTLLEMERLILEALKYQEQSYLSEMMGMDIVEVKIKSKPAKKRKEYKEGNIVAIPLHDIDGVYGYGLILKTGFVYPDDLYIQYFDLFTEGIISLSDFKRREKSPLFILEGGNLGIWDGVWKVIGSVPYDVSTFKMPDFYGTNARNDSYYISRGAHNDPNSRVKATKEEAEKVKNRDGSWGYGAVEKVLGKEYLKRNANE